MRAPRTVVMLLAVLALPGVAAPPAGALDWGLIVDNASQYTYAGDASFLQEDALALWLEAPLGRRLSLAVEGSYTYSTERPYLFNLDFLRVAGEFLPARLAPSQLGFTAGRFSLTDLSGLLLDDSVDGLQLFWRAPWGNLELSVGYTGLQLEPLSTISMSWADINSDSLLAPPRLLELLNVKLPALFARQDLLVSLLLQQDLRPRDDLLQEGDTVEVTGQGGRLSTGYLGGMLRGPLAGSLYYDLFAFLGTGKTLSYIDGEYTYAWIFSGLGGAALRYYRPQWLDSRAELRFLLASGDADFVSFVEGNREELSTMFVSVSQPELALLFTPELGNLGLLELSYSIKPVGVLQTLVQGFVFLRPTTGPISDARVDPASDSLYLGTEIDAVVRYRPFSDLGTALSLGVFFPGTAFQSDSRDTQFRALLEISLSF